MGREGVQIHLSEVESLLTCNCFNVNRYGDAFVGKFDMTSNIRSTSTSFTIASSYSKSVDGIKFLHIFLVGDPSVRCVSVEGVLSDDLS